MNLHEKLLLRFGAGRILDAMFACVRPQIDSLAIDTPDLAAAGQPLARRVRALT